MKTISTLFLAFLITLTCKAQGYQKMLADSVTEFDVMGIQYGVKPAGSQQTLNTCVQADACIWYAKKDTMYNGNMYKKIISTNVNFQGLMREDTVAKKVYFIPYCGTTEDLLYDFSLTQGGTINYTFPNSAGNVQSGIFTVDSIRIKHDYKSYYHKHFYLRNHSAGNIVLEMIEGVGNVTHPLFLYNFLYDGPLNWLPNCPAMKFDEILSCKIDNGKRVYFDSCAYMAVLNAGVCFHATDTCNYYNGCGSIDKYASINTVEVYPNPGNGNLFIKMNDFKNSSVEVYNSLGEKVFSKTVSSNTESLNLEKLNSGVYIIQVKQNGMYIYRSNIVLSK